MKYQDMLAKASDVKAAYYVDILNAVVYESRLAADQRRAARSVLSNWRLTTVEEDAIFNEACRIMQA
uniref:Uncharacterized protein n=1 Tax=Pseudomonas phage RVTF4 TaxID=3236931 RepID=A0AB39CC94_9VIRU